ncbi:hypothetical protein CORC01_07359 [Colletotrichum orchidophilum]|uniref:Uncharacterized protein n=1 Tax=Colletotrichum orchidophilum TaxID=1209926 RepID=A0A1G4B7D8_9PEZI|nr:uncharacterized protein CORC01_07359 [Colletotrichum orchidophilum]OHE97304.1 hypothetical protein CORC01_07359 [Colletotrichum orchidophilum]
MLGGRTRARSTENRAEHPLLRGSGWFGLHFLGGMVHFAFTTSKGKSSNIELRRDSDCHHHTIQSLTLRIQSKWEAVLSYPKHVWSPAGGWYAQPANWKRNTAVIGAVMAGVVAVIWKISAEKEVRYVMPQEGRFFPSRYWSKQLIEYDREQAARKAKDTTQAEAIQNS